MKRWRPVAGVGLGWILLVLVRLFEILLLNLIWIGAVFLTWGAWVVAGTVTVVVVVSALRRRRRLVAIVVLVAGLGSAALVARTEWDGIYVHGYYRMHRDDFAAVAALDEQGRLESAEYYGANLPGDLRGLSVNGRAARLSQDRGDATAARLLQDGGDAPAAGLSQDRGDAPAAGLSQDRGDAPGALFLLRVAGIPDGGAGYARLAPVQRESTFDCFGDPCQARWTVGDGWYWLGPAG
ncbi:hypothetical protein [Paractinoplanes brasiliensis]|uniref:hypothetical protein n=1 Tax=Paractinoplanes brasiliensis TaxID=52695 RepID=UPI001414F92E|nr:hypothetical protein [Actinoplanes brasiliensis]GID31693.1 hypothetical protein Abr02nite_66760 [Actinoplanes brasiliensis]